MNREEFTVEFNTIIDQIIEKEWPMFHTVNGESRVDCQEDRQTFYAMRRAQFSAWSRQAAESYLRDLEEAERTGRNLIREKYIRMMKSTDPRGYEALKGQLPPVSEQAEQLAAAIWGHFLTQTLRMREKYPAVALGGRPLLACEEGGDGWASIETYQTSELKTCSEDTLEALLAHVEALERQGVDIVRRIQENSVTCLGYRSLDEAERAMADRL